ncbi:hypothetical protein M0R45_035204 [Rubus argutus]|uniref:cellulase n=1 Tax=Rubus argutus TaxID=59490 RepID=A0AAW1VVC1_RUBAR
MGTMQEPGRAIHLLMYSERQQQREEDARWVVMTCSSGIVEAPALLDFARSQVNYILGSNPNGMSYMVGFGSKYPTQNAPNPNALDGAIVGGPNDGDGYTDSRSNFQMAEAATVTTAPLVGVLAKLA